MKVLSSGFGGSDAGIGLAHRLTEPANRRGILDALGGFHAGTHVNGPGPYPKNSFDHISGMQPTRQNDWTGHVSRNERPIEDLSAAAVALDVGVEKNGLGVGILKREV